MRQEAKEKLKSIKKEQGITLVALVVTIIILLILAGVAISMSLGDNGLFSKTEDSTDKYKQAQAREALELTLNQAMMQKYESGLNDIQLNDMIEQVGQLLEKEDENSNYQLVIVEGYVFEIDRSALKIQRYVDKKEEMENLELQVDKIKVGEDIKIQIVAKEEIKGITKIEVIFNNDIIKTYTYDNEKGKIDIIFDEIEENGEYIIRATAGKSKERKVEISEVIKELYLIKEGKDCTEVTGGWEGVPYYGRETGTLTFSSTNECNYANFIGTDSATIYIKATKNKIDWSQYKKIILIAQAYNKLSDYDQYRDALYWASN